MAELSPLVRQVIQNQGPPPPLHVAGELANFACWNWALTGCHHNAVWPTYMFGHVTAGQPVDDVLDHHGRGWFRTQVNADRLGQIQGDWLEAVSNNPDAARTAAVDAVMRLALEANGLALSAANGTAVTPYRFYVEYKTRLDNGAVGDIRPMFHHMWLDVHGRAIELFPGRSNIQIYQGRQPIDMALFAIWDCYLTGLHQRQVDRIVSVLKTTRANWTQAPAVPAPRQPWVADNTRAHCVFCGVGFNVLRRRHHCRRCGEIFCASCSDYTRAVVNPATRPGAQNVAIENDARVCIRCNG